MENWAIGLIIAGGVYDLGFAIFHLTFWKAFRWKEDLAKISRLNSGIFQIINLCLTFVFFLMAYISFFHVNDLATTGLGMALLIGFALFWFLRMVEQIIFFGFKRRVSILFTTLFLLGCLIYVAVAVVTAV
jgi:hypothetical protein